MADDVAAATAVAIDGPEVKPLDTFFSPVVIAICLAALFFVLCLVHFTCCVRRQRMRRAKSISDIPPAFMFHRPTAVKSPAGATTHYLKKSPSPTGSSKTPPTNSAPQTPSPTGNPPPIGGPLENGVQETTEREKNEDSTNKDANVTEKSIQKPIIPSGKQSSKQIADVYLGELVFTIRYRKDRSALIVSIVRIIELPARSVKQGCDPYVKLQLLPDKKHKVKTRVLRKCRNPTYEEDFTFYGINFENLSDIVLHFVVLSFDRYSRDDVIGEVFYGLDQLDPTVLELQEVACREEIKERSIKIRTQGRGELLVSLCWQPAASRLTVVVLKARNLPNMDVTGLADPYVKIYLTLKGQRLAKKKTHVKKRTLSPVFNESFVFDVPEEANDGLKDVGLEFLLLDWDRVTKNEVIGRIALGSNCSGTAQHHWNEVCNSPRRQIADWHKLQE